PPRSPPVLYVDNKAMLALCREQRLEHRTKHIALRYFLARELQQRGQLRLAYVASEANTADVFTKALAPCDHQRCCTQLAEIYAGAMAAQELRWLTYLLADLGELPRSPPVLYVDNKAMLALCREHRLEHRTKHIALRYFLARELQQRGQLHLAYVASEANTADIFTKALPPGDHQRFCTMLGFPTCTQLIPSSFIRFGLDLPVLRLHSDRGGEFSSDLLRAFCRAEGIRQTFTLLASPQQKGIAECRIGMVMEYATHQINLQPRVSLSETTPTLRWTGKVGDVSAFRVWGSQPFVRDTSVDKLSSHAVPCVFLGFPLDAPGWQFYHPTSRRVLSSQDVTFDESVSYYCLFPYRTASLHPPPLFLAPGTPPVDPFPPQGPAPSCVSQVDPADPVEVAIDSGAARGVEPVGVGTGGAEPGGTEPGGAEPGGAEPERVEPEGAEFGGAEPACAESGGSPGVPRTAGARGAAGAGAARGASRGATGAGGAGGAAGAGAAGGVAGAGEPGGAAGGGAAGGTAGAGAARGAAGAGAAGPGGARTGGTGAAGTGGAIGAGAAGTGAGGAAGVVHGDPGTEGTGTVSAVSGGATRPRPYYVPLLQQVLGLPPFPGPTPPLLSPPPVQSQSQLQPASPLPSPSPYSAPTRGLTESREPESRPVLPESRSASPVHTVRAGRRVMHPRPPPVPGTHSMTLRPSTAPQRVPLPSPPASSLLDSPDLESDSLRAASPTVTCFLASAITDPLLRLRLSVLRPSGSECALGTDVLDDRQEEFECFSAAVPHLVSMLLALEGEPDAPDIPTLRSYAETIEGPYSSQWQAAMDAEMASWKSTGTYVDEVPPPGANIVSGMWIFRVKWLPGSPPVFKARYVARGFSHRLGVDFFQTFSPTPKMTTLRVLLHVAAQRDYELNSLDYSTAFLQGILHEEIWLRRPPGFTGSFPPGTQWSLRRPVYGLRQAPREWHDTLRRTLATLGFAPSTADPSQFLRTDTTLPPFYVLVYVDDLVFASADTEALAHVKSELQKRHTCTNLGELTSYLGLRIMLCQSTIVARSSHSHSTYKPAQLLEFCGVVLEHVFFIPSKFQNEGVQPRAHREDVEAEVHPLTEAQS
ncbi:unnamed protein product, partial [Closterium sp. NIES-54]